MYNIFVNCYLPTSFNVIARQYQWILHSYMISMNTIKNEVDG